MKKKVAAAFSLMGKRDGGEGEKADGKQTEVKLTK